MMLQGLLLPARGSSPLLSMVRRMVGERQLDSEWAVSRFAIASPATGQLCICWPPYVV